MADRLEPFGRSVWRIPSEITAEGDRISWRASPFDRGARQTFDHLDSLFRLATDATQIARLAGWIGLLGICEHDRPFRHGLVDGSPRCWPTSDQAGGYETVAGWRYVNASAQRALRLAADVVARPEEMELRARLQTRIDAWMVMGEVRPALDDDRSVAFAGSGLLGDLAVQLLHSVLGVPTFDTCAGCGSVFPARRRRAPGKRAFCSNCGRTVAMRLASRDYRAANAPYIRERDRARKRRARGAATDLGAAPDRDR